MATFAREAPVRPAGARQTPVRPADVRRLLRRTAWRQRAPLALAAAGAVVRQLGFVAAPAFVGLAVDQGVEQGDLRAAAWWALALVGAGIAELVGMCAWDLGSTTADARAGTDLRGRIAGALLADAREPATPAGDGDLVLRAGRDVDALRTWVHGLATWVVIGVTIAVLVPGIARLDPALLVVVGASVPLLVGIGLAFPRAYGRVGARVAAAHGARADVVEHVLTGALTTRGSGTGPALLARHAAASADVTRHTVRAGDVRAGWSALGEGVPRVALAVGVLVGVGAVADGRLGVGGLVAFGAWMGTVGLAVQVGLHRVVQTVDARVAAGRIAEVLAAGKTAPAPAQRGSRIAAQVAQVERLVAEPGSRLVVVTGPVGSGKSTLLRALAGPGRVLVPQRPLVLARSVRENVTLGAGLDERAVRGALVAAALDGELEPDALVSGGSLSGGQVARLALARVLASDAPVLLLDEPTAALDPATEVHIVASLRAQTRTRTLVVASHRPAVVAAADAVVPLGDPGGGP